MTTTNAARPILKCAGGKTKLLPELLARVPTTFGTYHEPFVGGGALFWSLASAGRVKRARLGDTNADFVCAYCVLREGHADELVKRLRRMRNDEAYFKRLRAKDPTRMPDVERAARAIYLNKTCYNGLWRVNRSGQFNTPFGCFANPAICDEDNLLACARLLELTRTTIAREPFEAVLQRAKSGDLAYFDPPYLPVKDDSFTAYGSGGFGWSDHVRLRDVAHELKERGVHVIISNSAHPRIEALYTELASTPFTVDTVHAARAINSRGDGRGKVEEFIIT